VGAGGREGWLAGAPGDDRGPAADQFNTVLGPIDFDEKGDLTVQNPVWYVWRGGTYVPLEQDTAKE
jgi:hypothetical protein